MDIPESTTAPQLAWHVITGSELVPSENGICRLCGGNLIGGYDKHKPGKKWMDEYQTVARYSDYCCEPCIWARESSIIDYKKVEHRRLLGSGFQIGMIISPEKGQIKYSALEVFNFIEAMKNLNPPFLLAVRTSGKDYRRHLIYEMKVSWSNHPAVATYITDYDNFTLPIYPERLEYAVNQLIKKFQGKIDKSVYRTFLGQKETTWDPLWDVAFRFYYYIASNNLIDVEETR